MLPGGNLIYRHSPLPDDVERIIFKEFQSARLEGLVANREHVILPFDGEAFSMRHHLGKSMWVSSDVILAANGDKDRVADACHLLRPQQSTAFGNTGS